MKIRRRNEHRPLLLMQEAPILSDEMPPSFEEEQQSMMMKLHHNDEGNNSNRSRSKSKSRNIIMNNNNNNNTNDDDHDFNNDMGGGGGGKVKQQQQQQSKRSWRRLFGGGKGKSAGTGGGRQQQQQQPRDDDFVMNDASSFATNNSGFPPSPSPSALQGMSLSSSNMGGGKTSASLSSPPTTTKTTASHEQLSRQATSSPVMSVNNNKNHNNKNRGTVMKQDNKSTKTVKDSQNTATSSATASAGVTTVFSLSPAKVQPTYSQSKTKTKKVKGSKSSSSPSSQQSSSSPTKKKITTTTTKGSSSRNDNNDNNNSNAIAEPPEFYRTGQSLVTNSSRTNRTVSTMVTATQQQQQQPQKSTRSSRSKNSFRRDHDHQPGIATTPGSMTTSTAKSTPTNNGNNGNIGDGVGGGKEISSRKILSRPFGREHILSMNQTWLVHVARAEWEPDDSQWKYRVTIQRREGNKLYDFANGFTLRSLQDFAWLEQSLTNEFLGGLLLPSLSIYVGVADIQSCEHEIDSRLLTNWLSDTLNGVRGQGELQLKLTKVDVSTCESIDAFLYRADLEPLMDLPRTPVGISTPLSSKSPRKPGLGEPNSTRNGTAVRTENGSDHWHSFFPELCYTDCVRPASVPVSDVVKTPVNIMKNCSSPALGTARTFNVQQNSFVEATMTFDENNSSLAIHSSLLKGERDLIVNWRMQSLQTMEKLRILQEQEKHIGAAWKRFAISVSNLFAYEKDVETARLGDSKSRRDLQMPHRKLQKSAVDDCLRILARQKVERSTPSIESVNLMLGAYVADLSTVQPAIQAYLGGLHVLASEKALAEGAEASSISSGGLASDKMKRQSSTTFADKIQASLNEVKKQLVMNSADESNGMMSGGSRCAKSEEERRYRQRQQVQTIENRVLMNEVLLKDFMTTLCATASTRTARMVYSYLDKEIVQCVALSEAANEMKSKINIASKDTLSRMNHRHKNEIKEDKSTEMKLVNRIVNIGSNTKKFSKEEDDDNVGEEVEKGVELSAELAEEENRKAQLRDAAMAQCRERIGRWDAKVAMKIMEAVGVSDANVRVEETTRDLRMVRKYAIGLRENVERCTEALDILRMSILQSGVGDVRDIRDDFMSGFRNLLSLAYVPSSDDTTELPSKLLQKEGINLSDPAGWISKDVGSCGLAISSYTETRDSGTEWLLESLSELLKAYHERVQTIESFVYMECVGIQLEKHFSHVRATALTAFEKKTDITSAINIATRKKMPVLVKELQAKLDAVGADVSHTTVKDAKEAHLESKKLKEELHTLAMRRLNRARETSTEQAIKLMTVWAKEEETASSNEKELLDELKVLVEQSLSENEIVTYVESSPSRI